MSTDDQACAFALILSLGERLIAFSFEQSVVTQTSQLPSIRLPPTSAMYSSLTKLNVDVGSFDECLTILRRPFRVALRYCDLCKVHR